MRCVNTLILIAGLGALSAIPSRTQPPQPPANICISGAVDPATGLPLIKCGNQSIVVPPVPAPVTTPPPSGVIGGPCAAPGSTPPGGTVYAQDPATKACFPLVLVSDPGFTASVVPTANYWGWYMINLPGQPAPSSASLALMVGTGFPNPAQANPPQPQ